MGEETTADARYDAVADFYRQGWTDTYDDSVSRAFFDLVGPVAGQTILDVAAGHGRITRELARRGARADGLDLSAALLAAAREEEVRASLGVRYFHGDASAADALSGRQYHGVTISFGLSDIDDLEGLARNVSRWLVEGGFLVAGLLHPCFAGGGAVSAAWPRDGTYYREGFFRADGAASTLRQQVGAHHRMLATYLNAFLSHGLNLDRVAEPPPSDDWQLSRPAAASGPVYLVLRFVKGPR